MKHLKFSLIFATMMVAALLVFAGCKPADDPREVIKEKEVEKEKIVEKQKAYVLWHLTSSDSIVGDWQSSGPWPERFLVQTTNFANSYQSNSTWIETYTGNELCVKFTNDSKTAGYIYMKYTKSILPDNTYSTTAPDVGKWYALHFKNLDTSASPNTVQIAGAAKTNGQTSCSTLEGAVEEFTVENGYFAWYSTLSRQ